MKKLKNYIQYIKEDMNIDDIKHQDLDEDFKEYTFDDVLSASIYYFNIIFEYNDINKTFDFNIYIDDVIILDSYVNELNWVKNSPKVDKHIDKELCKYFKIDKLKNLTLNKFLLIRFLLYKYNEYLSFGEMDKYIKEDENINCFSIYTNSQSVQYILNIFNKIGEYIYDDNIIDKTIEKYKNIFNDEYFIDIIKNDEYLYNKYKYYLDGKKFDLI